MEHALTSFGTKEVVRNDSNQDTNIATDYGRPICLLAMKCGQPTTLMEELVEMEPLAARGDAFGELPGIALISPRCLMFGSGAITLDKNDASQQTWHVGSVDLPHNIDECGVLVLLMASTDSDLVCQAIGVSADQDAFRLCSN